MAERKSDRWISIVQSVLLHGAVVALLAYGWFTYKKNTPALRRRLSPSRLRSSTPMRAKVSKPVRPPPPEPEPEPPPPEPEVETGPPTPSPEEVAQRQAEQRKLEEMKQAEEQRVAEEKQAAEQKRIVDEQQAQQRKKQEDAEAKRVAEQKRIADVKRKAEEKKKMEEARLREQREAELRRSLEAGGAHQLRALEPRDGKLGGPDRGAHPASVAAPALGATWHRVRGLCDAGARRRSHERAGRRVQWRSGGAGVDRVGGVSGLPAAAAARPGAVRTKPGDPVQTGGLSDDMT